MYHELRKRGTRDSAFYGRRKGHRLRSRQAKLVDSLLPRLALDLTRPAPAALATLFPAPVEAVRLELPIHEVYSFWRRFENLPRFMRHLDSVREDGPKRSHWVAAGPLGVAVEWDAELINEVQDKVIGWRSLPGSDVTTAGSVNFDSVRGGRETQVTVNLQYAAPAGKAGAFVATLFGREPSQTIREDLRRLKQILEAGEIAQAVAPATRERR